LHGGLTQEPATIRSIMKAFLRIAAALAFLALFSAGAALFSVCLSAEAGQQIIFPLVLGLFFVGNACFVGPLLLALAEKCDGKEETR
jgi:hypothetical protein